MTNKKQIQLEGLETDIDSWLEKRPHSRITDLCFPFFYLRTSTGKQKRKQKSINICPFFTIFYTFYSFLPTLPLLPCAYHFTIFTFFLISFYLFYPFLLFAPPFAPFTESCPFLPFLPFSCFSNFCYPFLPLL